MMWNAYVVSRRAMIVLACCSAVLGLVSSPANARVFVGIGVPFYGPGFYPSPYYYPPPVYYPPPPVYYAPPQVYTPPPVAPTRTGGGQMCYAGAYTCPMDHPVATGGGCYCLGNGGDRVWGRAN